MNTKITALEASSRIEGCLKEVAAEIEWLANNKPLYNPQWDKAEKDVQDVMLARQRYLEGEYELAIKALPEF